jgi:hypothetical protein
MFNALDCFNFVLEPAAPMKFVRDSPTARPKDAKKRAIREQMVLGERPREGRRIVGQRISDKDE